MIEDFRTIATFLPQFHSDKYNDQWWGDGFTEWDNVKNATPLFRGHVQPKKPIDGYYDLSAGEEIERQYKAALKWGIDSFMIYHYWSNGVRPLSTPIDVILANRQLEISYCLCWANHPWTRTWRNRSGALDLLLDQSYEGQEMHIQFIVQAMKDQRYTRINGRPIFSIYRPLDVRDLKGWCASFRQHAARELGVDPYLIGMIKSGSDMRAAWLMDACCIFQPSAALFGAQNLVNSPDLRIGSQIRRSPTWAKRIMYLVQDLLPSNPRFIDYEVHCENVLNQYIKSSEASEIPIIPMACCGFDNTPRYRRRATVMTAFSERIFESHLSKMLNHVRRLRTAKSRADPPFWVINSWNEWGEGMFLQADEEFGLGKLKALRSAIGNA